MDFVGSVFNVKWGAIKSFDCDIYAKVWLGSLLFVFFYGLFSPPCLCFKLFISFVFEEFNEAENTVM